MSLLSLNLSIIEMRNFLRDKCEQAWLLILSLKELLNVDFLVSTIGLVECKISEYRVFNHSHTSINELILTLHNIFLLTILSYDKWMGFYDPDPRFYFLQLLCKINFPWDLSFMIILGKEIENYWALRNIIILIILTVQSGILC